MSLPAHMFKRKNRDGYWTSWFDRRTGKQVVRKLAETKELAVRVLAKLQHEVTTGAHEKQYARQTLGEFYEQHYKPDFLSAPDAHSWAGKQRLHIERYILPTFWKEYLDGITQYSAQSWYQRLLTEHSRKYANGIAATLKRLLARAEGQFIERSPIAKLKLVANEKRMPSVLTKDDLAKLVTATSGRDRAMIVLWATTGLRVAEMAFLQCGDIDLIGRRVHVRNKPQHSLKDHEDRTILIPDTTVAAVRPYVEGRNPAAYFYSVTDEQPYANVMDHVKKVFKAAGVPHATGLIMRHTYASNWASSGGNLYELQRQMGHSSIVTTQSHYMAWVPGSRSSVESVDFGVAGTVTAPQPAAPSAVVRTSSKKETELDQDSTGIVLKFRTHRAVPDATSCVAEA